MIILLTMDVKMKDIEMVLTMIQEMIWSIKLDLSKYEYSLYWERPYQLGCTLLHLIHVEEINLLCHVWPWITLYPVGYEACHLPSLGR